MPMSQCANVPMSQMPNVPNVPNDEGRRTKDERRRMTNDERRMTEDETIQPCNYPTIGNRKSAIENLQSPNHLSPNRSAYG
jgi:hypothetical protein